MLRITNITNHPDNKNILVGLIMKRRNFVLSIAFVLGLGILGLGTVGATSVQDLAYEYDLIVPGSVGLDSPAYSSKQQKILTDWDAKEENYSIGGGKTLRSAVFWGNDRVTPKTSIEKGDEVEHKFNKGEGRTDRLFRLDHVAAWYTVVDVESSGTWDPK